MQLRHIGIVCQNLEKSLKFYCHFLGGTIERQMEESGTFIETILGKKSVKVTTVKLDLLGGGAQLELLFFKDLSNSERNDDLFSTGLTHFALKVSKLDRLHKEMQEAGVFFISEPQISEDGLAKVCFCRDPSGVYIELVELMNPQ